MVERADRKVAEKRKYAVSVVAEAEVARPLELVYEIKTVCVVDRLIRLYGSPVQERYRYPMW